MKEDSLASTRLSLQAPTTIGIKASVEDIHSETSSLSNVSRVSLKKEGPPTPTKEAPFPPPPADTVPTISVPEGGTTSSNPPDVPSPASQEWSSILFKEPEDIPTLFSDKSSLFNTS